MKVIIYANGSSAIGIGHIMRTLTLAKELKKREIYVEYIIDNSDNSIIKLLQNNGFYVIVVEDILNYLSSHQKPKYDLAIVDDHSINENGINKFYNIAKKIVYIDDLAKFSEYNMDILVNSSIEALSIDYKGCAKKLLGPKYAILRDEFRNKKYKVPKPNVEKVMITLGGGDEYNITKDILDSLLDNYYDIEYNVILGNSYIYKDFMLENYKYNNVKFYMNVKNMKNLMINNDLAISAGGNTLYELCACGIPTIAIIIADNQRKFVQVIHRKTGIDYIDLEGKNFKFKKENFLDIFERNIKNYKYREKISKQMFHLVDGNGCIRIVDEIMKLF